MEFPGYTEAAEKLRCLGTRVTRKGETLLDWRCDEECRRNVYSVTKSYTCAAVGFAVQEGLLSLDEPLTEAFRGDLPDRVGEHLKKARIEDLLTMHLGQRQAHLMGGQRPRYAEDDWVRLSLSIPFEDAPGTRFVYNNVGPYLAGVLVERRAGCDLASYLYPRLFAPLGLRRPTWELDPMGHCFGAGGLFLSLTEMHAFGEFLLAGGTWQGKPRLDGEWIRRCAADYHASGYGYLFWRGEYNSFRADGKYGQYIMILPEKESVITVVSECRETDRLLRLVYDAICARL